MAVTFWTGTQTCPTKSPESLNPGRKSTIFTLGGSSIPWLHVTKAHSATGESVGTYICCGSTVNDLTWLPFVCLFFFSSTHTGVYSPDLMCNTLVVNYSCIYGKAWEKVENLPQCDTCTRSGNLVFVSCLLIMTKRCSYSAVCLWWSCQ